MLETCLKDFMNLKASTTRYFSPCYLWSC